MKVHKMTKGDFEKLDKKYEILNYIAGCPDIFDSLTEEEMAEEIKIQNVFNLPSKHVIISL
jgi:hypothetical protein